MPAPSKWAKAVKDNGFDMEMDTDFDVQTFTGFLPCKYKGVDAGFEYYYEPITDEILDDIDLSNIDKYDIMVSFTTHSDMRELTTSIIASSVLAAIADGVVHDISSDEYIKGKDAIGWAKKGEEETSVHL